MVDFQALFRAIPGMYLVMDTQANIVAASDAYLHTVERDRSDVVGHNLLDFYDRSKSEAITQCEEETLSASFNRVLKHNVSHTLPPRQYHLCPEGNPYWKLVHSPLYGDNREITHVVQCIENVSTVMQMQRRLETVMENIQDAFVVYDSQWSITYINSRGAQMAGMETDGLIGQNPWELFPEAKASHYYRELQRAMTQRKSVKVELFYEPWQRWFELRAYPCPEGLLMFSTDITERKQTAVRLRRSEARFRQMAETIPSVFWLQNVTQRKMLYVSPAYSQIWGRDRDALYSSAQTWQESIHPDHRNQLKQASQRCLDQGHSEEEYRIIRGDGTVRWIRDRGYVVSNDGTEKMLAGVAEDITEQKQAEAALRQEERKFRRLLDSNIFGVLFGDCGGGVSYVNDYLLELLGYSREEAEAMDLRWDDLTPPEFAAADQKALAELAQRGVCTPYEKEYFHKEGYRLPILVGASLMQTPDKTADGVQQQDVMAFIIDLSSLKQVSEERDRFFNSTSDMLAIANTDGYFTQVNPAWERVLGWTEAEMTAQPYFELIHPEDLERTRLEAQSTARGNDAIGFENRYRTKAGTYRWLAWNVTAMPEQQKLYAVAWDNITEQKRIEQEREQLLVRELAAREKAETANRMKDEFLAVISHELRTPLNPILGWTEILLRRDYNEQQYRKGLETIQRNATLQATLVEDLLDVSRMLRGKLVLNRNAVDLGSVVCAAMETVQFSAEAKRISMQLDAPPLPQYQGDRDRLQQVMWNLLSNAIKFTPEQGQIAICLRQMMDSEECSSLEVSVTDTGRGIEAEFLPFLFDSFRQEDFTITRSFSGLGLGLSIVRHVVELHGGTVTASSPGRDQGATFTVKLPLGNVGES